MKLLYFAAIYFLIKILVCFQITKTDDQRRIEVCVADCTTAKQIINNSVDQRLYVLCT